MINDHLLCYGTPGLIHCDGCARNIAGKIKNIDFSVFDLLTNHSFNLSVGTCDNYTKKMF